ncbi:MAG: Crp/Fnr family transcriptional regulator [Pseudomonadales bacterium]|nr:Crp/Fnr family transcriptional regulator [Pseudomonadales bacterium]
MLYRSGQAFDFVYFPLSGFISLAVTVEGHQSMEMGLIGHEGMLGVSLVLGVDVVPLYAVVRGAGTALRMSTKEFKYVLRNCPIFQSMLDRYVCVLMAELSQTIACTGFHDVKSRLARWLLMINDRANNDRFYLTHQILAEMLGVQRSAISIAAGLLQHEGSISYSRGNISVLSRKKLQAASCECYMAILHEYERLLTPTPA